MAKKNDCSGFPPPPRLTMHFYDGTIFYFTSLLLLIFATIVNAQPDDLLPLHSLSPPERSSHMPLSLLQWNRAKRQAYQVYLGGEVSVSVDHGTVDSGPWSEWTVEKDCSRTCGGGVTMERRVCADNTCIGPAIRYVSCNVQPCPADAKDFRAEQCTGHNDDPLDGHYYKWVPYPSKNKCELTCRPEDANFYYKFADKVVDGTRCDPYGDDICVDGICLPVGCDDKLGSVAKKDKCGVCNGDGSQCKTVEGLFDERNLSPGYHDIIALPAGATAIHVEELQSTSNVFAIKNGTGSWLLNGNYQIQVLDKNILAGGTAFRYEKGEGGTEKLTANGPLKEPITITLLLQRGATKKSAVKYEFSIPLEKDVKYLWKPGEWSGCSVTCGKGIRTRALYCTEMATQNRMDDAVCDEQNATKPEFEKTCKTVDCEPEWFLGEWEPCSSTCGDKGLQFRVVYCHRVFADGRRMTVSDSNCTERGLPRPELSQQCARWSCPEWQAGPWSACSSQCGDAKQFRSVTCRSAKEGEEGKLLAAEACAGQSKPIAERDCNLGPCEGLQFHTSDWELCQRCNDTEEHRNVTCQDKNGREYPLEKCLDEKKGQKQIPEDTRACASPAPCLYEWHTSQWSKCSTECGHGHKSRKVFCAINEQGQTKRVDESLCGGEQPQKTEECVNEEKCTGTYFSGPWTECTAKCDGGKQTRVVVCLNYDRKPVSEWCDEKEKPTVEQECNTEPCPKCSDSEFGCCPDNVTFATGQYLAGCSNCSLSEFGCCSDNMTTQQGPDGQGCPDWVEPPKKVGGEQAEPRKLPTATEEPVEEGSGEEPMPIVRKLEVQEAQPEIEICEIQNEETGEKLQIPCTTIAPPLTTESSTAADEVTLEPETTDGNATEKHCSKTEFGCCQDWYTPAEGPNLAGCPQFVLGACNDTKHGCCLDNVTLARGPHLEGCGDPTCAASLYGCCKDRRTIAFGPHYAGCERSSFPCELSQYGCCSDGVTAALGANGTGCGASCLLTKFGCCPDGKTQAKGANNEGCGCKYAQYGCCPDGKNSAKGPGFYGCPESCALSKHGCCPDGKTEARGPNKEGCPCQYTRWGCCEDGETTALGPLNEGCDDCRYAKHGCCQDGVSKASGPDFGGCPTTTPAPYIVDGTVSPSSIVSCSLPHDQGQVCAPGYQLVWFYDIAEGRCSQFWFGGCGGNENRFTSKEQCEQTCVEPPGIGRCYLPKVEGPQRCTQLAARYWYDYQTKQCSAFWHRGCLGNANNFDSWEQCQNFCTQADASQVHVQVSVYPSVQRGPLSVPQMAQVAPQQQQLTAVIMPIPEEIKSREACNLRPDVGKCEGHFDSWYYEVATGQCERFTYSGCGGNANRFNNAEECQALCLRRHDYAPPPASGVFGVSAFGAQAQEAAPVSLQLIGDISKAHLVPVCEAPKNTGSCKQFSTKWYFNKLDGTCNRFHYGGCEGNANRFETEQECRNTCGEYRDACLLPKVIGPCVGKIDRFYYDYHAKQCLPFDYSGCLGNNNNFRSIEDCRARCQLIAINSLLDDHQVENGMDSVAAMLRLRRRSSAEFSGNQQTPIVAVQDAIEGVDDGGEKDEEEDEEQMEILVSRDGLLYGQLPELCLLAEEPGNCFGQMLRFRFDPDSGDCVGFFYTGCGQNANHFISYEACARACGRWKSAPVCEQPADSGNGSQECGNTRSEVSIPKWHFDAAQNRCALFLWSGCGGNGNRFQSKSECENLCRHEYSKDSVLQQRQHNYPCGMPLDAGPCEDFITLWYFDNGEHQCRKFTFGGCRGNANRFVTKQDCVEQCQPTTLDAANNDTQKQQNNNNGPSNALSWSAAQQQHRLLTAPSANGPVAVLLTALRPRIFAFPIGTLIAGTSNLTLNCVVGRGMQPQHYDDADGEANRRSSKFTWYKNNRELRLPSDQQGIQLNTNNGNIVGEIKLVGVGVEDSGWYACAWDQSLISEPVDVNILEDDTSICAGDKGRADVCLNVLNFGLCSTLRYGHYCCWACRHGMGRNGTNTQ